MGCSVRACGVCSTSCQSGAVVASTKTFTAPVRWQGWNLKSCRAEASLYRSNRVQPSRHSIVSTKPFRKQKNLRNSRGWSERVGQRMIRATLTTKEKASQEESTTSRDEPRSGTLPEQTVLSQHPWDPHEPNFSILLPESVRPYPSFEGWFVRMWDPESNFSAAVIMATNYATQESQVSLLFTPSREDLGTRNAGAVRSEEHGKYVLRTYAVAEMSKDATFVDVPSGNVSEDRKPLNSEPVGFEWNAPGLGMIKTTADETEIDVTIMGYSFQAHLTHNTLWDADQSERGPEGWARGLPLPTHWYVYSLGSKVDFKFSGPDGVLARSGKGLAHQEKNWGITFPAGHVWFQGFSSDNIAQVIGSAAHYKIGELKTPYIFSLGYRSPAVSINMRTNDLGTIFENISISPLTGEFSMEGVSATHTIFITAQADPKTLSEAVLAPMGKTHWASACRESYLAEVDVEVFEHAIWGIAGRDKLVDKRKFPFAALEFGEDLLKAAAEKAAQENQENPTERSQEIDS